MGNSTTKQVQEQNNLIVKARLLEKQVKECSKVDAGVANSITFVKQSRKYTSLILPGGGLASLSSVYMMEYLSKHGCIDNIKSIGAGSFASIVAVLYAIGVSVDDIKKHIRDIQWHKLFNKTLESEPSSDIFHIASEFGQCNGKMLHDTLTELIEQYTGNKHYTMGDVLKHKGIDLIITAADISTRSMVYFNTLQHGNVPLRIILRAACSLPEILCPVILDGHYLVDSSLLDHCPTYLFDASSHDLYNYQIQLGLSSINPNNLSIRLLRDLPIKNQSLMSDITMQYEPIKVKTALIYRLSLIDIAASSQDEKFISQENNLRLITVHVPCFSITKTTLSNDEMQNMKSCIGTAMSQYVC